MVVEPVAVGSVRAKPVVDKTFRGYDQDQPTLSALIVAAVAHPLVVAPW